MFFTKRCVGIEFEVHRIYPVDVKRISSAVCHRPDRDALHCLFCTVFLHLIYSDTPSCLELHCVCVPLVSFRSDLSFGSFFYTCQLLVWWWLCLCLTDCFSAKCENCDLLM
jgi:hypothetical protein